jgi:hypothetical protein
MKPLDWRGELAWMHMHTHIRTLHLIDRVWGNRAGDPLELSAPQAKHSGGGIVMRGEDLIRLHNFSSFGE